jgi:glycosyltransferase involved in cell wall biosynthesis
MFNVAVITPVFNTQDYLHRCIKSVLAQTGVTLQYFIIDDGSTDNSASIAQFYQRNDPRITFIRKANEGQGVARNIGIKLADAEYIYFVDSDDYLGEGALSILFEAAKANELDICSPKVPKHYFDKPLEYVSCLPCKSQFIKLKIIRDFNILQPDIKSGQDGVFSHLVLTHCIRIGMAESATFHYTHAREGSTFAAHLKRHDLVPVILEQHLAAIEQHYDKFDLWEKNALRLLGFIADESLRNRLEPHLAYLDQSQKCHCFNLLSRIAKRAFNYITSQDKQQSNPAIAALVTKNVDQLVLTYETEFAGKQHQPLHQGNHNIHRDKLLICNYANAHLGPIPGDNNRLELVESEWQQTGPAHHQAESISDIGDLQREIKSLKGKVDLAINSINNSAIQLTSAILTPASNLLNGNPDILVSLTTLPHRLPLIHLAIESIFSQTVLPGRIVLWITDRIESGNYLTPQLESLVARGLEIRKVEDVGPHTKLIYSLKEFSEKNIITVDDDIIYPINAISCLWEQHTNYPNAVICNWARELTFDSAGKVRGVRSGKLLTPPLLESEIEQALSFEGKPNLLAFPYGTSGVLYPPKALNSRVFEVETFRQLCPKEDDIWFKAMGLLNRTPVVVTNLGINPIHHCITGSQSKALRHDNHGMSHNSVQMEKVFSYFALNKLINN